MTTPDHHLTIFRTLDNVATVTHCNFSRLKSRQLLSALITMPIPSLKFLTYNVFIADALLYAVTVTFDPLTLNVCSVSAGMCSNSVPYFSEIERSAAALDY